MNPDAHRDVMDRSHVPYEGAHDINKVTTGLDELSLKKQLPLRQQTSRRMFRYNTSMTKSVHLFHQGDIGTANKDATTSISNYNTSGMYYTGNVITPSANKPPVEVDPHFQRNIHTSQYTNHYTSEQVVKKHISSNPYVRPVSATEVAANINGEKTKKIMQKTVAEVSDRSFSDKTSQTLQRNSFLRPLSGVSQNGKEKLHDRKQQDSPIFLHRHNNMGSELSAKLHSENKVVFKNKFQFASTSSSPIPTPQVPMASKSTSDAVYSKSSNQDCLSSTHSSHVRSTTHSSHVRNPSYSPNKPYNASKLNDLLSSDSLVSQYSSPANDAEKTGLDGNRNVLQSVSNSNAEEAYHTSCKTSISENVVPESGTLRKMPVTNTLTGTVYYRKASVSNPIESSVTLSPMARQNKNSSNLINLHRDEPKDKESSDSLTSNEETTPKSSSVRNRASSNRPVLERSNASLQFQSKPTISDSKKVSAPQTAHQSRLNEKCMSTHSKLSSDSNNRIIMQTNNETSMTKPPLKEHPRMLVKRDLAVQHATSLEKRSVADGAPSRTVQYVERKLEAAMKTQLGEDEYDEDDYIHSSSEDPYDGDENVNNAPNGERLPGDGEVSFDDYDDDDGDEADFEDSQSGAESDAYSIKSCNSSQPSQKPHINQPNTTHITTPGKQLYEIVKSWTQPLRPTTHDTVIIKPALWNSMFKHTPPTINFVAEGERTEQLPWELRKLLKWKMSPITPIVVKKAIARIGFRISNRNHDWLGCFGKHMKAHCFKFFREYQKINHFPGSFQIGRKDRLWRNLSRMQVHFGKREFSFFPHTYVLPADFKQLKRAWDDGNSKQKWIIKPPASARGMGIRVIGKWSQIPKRKPVIVQKYLSRPYLINDSKFDMRIYVYVSSYDPLRAYVYDDGLARFASCKYSTSMKSLSNRYMHLTNYSINKKNSDYLNNTDNSLCHGHKWSLKALWNYMKMQGINTTLIWDNICDLIIKTIICGDSPINSLIKSNARSRYCCHELFGFDILLDQNLKPWILEVNISPSLHSNSQLDVNIKGGMIKDLLNIAGFKIPDERDVTISASPTDFSSYSPFNKYCIDKRLYTNQLASDERAKHAYFVQKHQDEQIMQSILDVITPDDIRHLCESIDEDSRKGNFQRLFPTPHTHRYLHYFEQQRYYNLLLNQWVLRYNRMEKRGILLLQSLCEEKIHLENPTNNPKHQWAPPNSTVGNIRSYDMRLLGSQNSAKSNVPPTVYPRVLKKLPSMSGQSLSHSSSTNSLHPITSSSQLHTPSHIRTIASPSR